MLCTGQCLTHPFSFFLSPAPSVLPPIAPISLGTSQVLVSLSSFPSFPSEYAAELLPSSESSQWLTISLPCNKQEKTWSPLLMATGSVPLVDSFSGMFPFIGSGAQKSWDILLTPLSNLTRCQGKAHEPDGWHFCSTGRGWQEPRGYEYTNCICLTFPSPCPPSPNSPFSYGDCLLRKISRSVFLNHVCKFYLACLDPNSFRMKPM